MQESQTYSQTPADATQPPEGYFIWDVEPVIFTIPEFQLPFPLSVWGLVAGFILIWYGFQRLMPHDPKERAAEPAWKGWAIIGGALILGQLPFLLIGGPTLSSIGPIAPRWYGLMFACAFIFGYMLAGKMMREGGRTQEELDRLLFFVLIATIIGARLGHVIFYDLEYYLRNPGLILAIWRGGLASHGAAIGIIIAMWLYVRRTPRMSFLWLADRVVPSVAIGGMFIRIGNFFNSEILGKATDLPWAVVFARVDLLPRHPSMLYESLSTVVVLAVLMWIYNAWDKRPPEGSLFGAFLVLLFSGRFLIEFTKLYHASYEADWVLHMGQWLSIPMVLLGAWLLYSKVDWSKPAKRTGTT
ncbi:MAG: prolipoprotein diacylglyceryl transferase [Balneolaceae bacterium]